MSVFMHSGKRIPNNSNIRYCIIQQSEDGFVHKLIIGDLFNVVEFFESCTNSDYGYDVIISTFDVDGYRLDEFNVIYQNEFDDNNNVFTIVESR